MVSKIAINFMFFWTSLKIGDKDTLQQSISPAVAAIKQQKTDIVHDSVIELASNLESPFQSRTGIDMPAQCKYNLLVLWVIMPKSVHLVTILESKSLYVCHFEGFIGRPKDEDHINCH